MRAAILSIGDELVLGQSTDTNSAWIAARLTERGVRCEEHRTVDDDRTTITGAMHSLLAGRDLLVVTGGLGPTADDLTRHALLDLVDPGAALVEDAGALATLERWFAGRAGGMPPANRIQAMRPPSATLIDNPRGTAPGLHVAPDGRLVVCLPGPPREMQPMFEAVVIPWVDQRAPARIATAIVPSVGLGESDAARRLGELMDRDRRPLVGTTASGGIVSARIRAVGPDAERLVAGAVEEVVARWHPYAFARRAESLAEAVGRRMAEAGRRLVTCESCTGGGLGAMLTAVPGSSAWYRGGWVTYDNEMKATELGVPRPLLEAHGAVSAEVAMAMAIGGLRRGAADEALSITGIAGPGGGSADKPVGTVWIGHASRAADGTSSVAGSPSSGRGSGTAEVVGVAGVAGVVPSVGPDALRVRARRFRFHGGRETVRDRSATMAMAILRLVLDGHESWPPGRTAVPLLWEEPRETRRADRRALAAVAPLLAMPEAPAGTGP